MRSCRRRPGPAGNRVTEQNQHGPAWPRFPPCRGDPDSPFSVQIQGVRVSGRYPLLARLARLAPDGKTGTSGQTGTKWVALRPGSFAHTHADNPGVSAGAQQGTETVPGLGVAAETARSPRGYREVARRGGRSAFQRFTTHSRYGTNGTQRNAWNESGGEALRRKINRECP